MQFKLSWAAVALAILPVLAAAAEAPLQIEFETPALFEGSLEQTGTQTLFLLLLPDSDLNLTLDLPEAATYTNITRDSIRASVTEPRDLVEVESPTGSETKTTRIPATRISMSPDGQRAGALLIEGPVTSLATTGNAPTHLENIRGKDCWEDTRFGTGRLNEHFRTDYRCWTQDMVSVWSERQTLTVSVAEGATFEWANLDPSCPVSTACVDGARWYTHTEAIAGNRADTETRYWGNLSGTLPAFEFSASEVWYAAVGPKVDLSITGKTLLPSTTINGCTADCPSPGQTLELHGAQEYRGISPDSSTRMSAEYIGNPSWARLDEAAVDPKMFTTFSATAATAMGLTALLTTLKFLTPLFTRISGKEALEQPRRRRLFDYIQMHPGATFREVVRETEVPAGTARHHLTILRRSGLLVEKRHRSTLRFFENHGRFDATWDTVVLRREEPLRILHDWILSHQGCNQKDILEAMDLQGWSRSTTQHRIGRLQGGGLVTMRPQGRHKRYMAHATPQPLVRDDWEGLGPLRPAYA